MQAMCVIKLVLSKQQVDQVRLLAFVVVHHPCATNRGSVQRVASQTYHANQANEIKFSHSLLFYIE